MIARLAVTIGRTLISEDVDTRGMGRKCREIEWLKPGPG